MSQGRETNVRTRASLADGGGESIFRVVVVSGPDVGAAVTLDSDKGFQAYLGTSAACALRLTDPMVSRRHLALSPSGNAVMVRDLESTNGTMVNGAEIMHAKIRPSDTLRVGDTTLRIEATTAQEPAVPLASSFGRVVGGSIAMRRLYPMLKRIAASSVPVIVEGETGTGKELLAEAIHEMGPRAAYPFVVFDCTSHASSLIESALFGHEKGAFTGATSAKPGVFELAHGGTLLIDEIGDLDIALQPKLLRALQRSEVQRLGATKWTKVDVRIIAATRRDLERAIQEGRFRDDLYFRLGVARIELPPLRAREGDVELLARKIWEGAGGDIAAFPVAMLTQRADDLWPGNIRELYNVVLHRLAMGDLASESAAPSARISITRPLSEVASKNADYIESVIAGELTYPLARRRILEDFERAYVRRLLAAHDGSVAKAAAASGIARRYFYSIMGKVPRE
jgi:two-component system, NtrC family, response regulator HydG